jgi:hypothetical protein
LQDNIQRIGNFPRGSQSFQIISDRRDGGRGFSVALFEQMIANACYLRKRGTETMLEAAVVVSVYVLVACFSSWDSIFEHLA